VERNLLKINKKSSTALKKTKRNNLYKLKKNYFCKIYAKKGNKMG